MKASITTSSCMTGAPSCIQDLKNLVNHLTDRDLDIKNHLANIKSIIADTSIKTDTIKIKKIKQILKNG
jgi:ATP-dependent helicase YprA (DUF1998 family)|tara:strand:+ start:153 stop:359 length:207 start_codon:yes stop_codon:yes gene_type:complete